MPIFRVWNPLLTLVVVISLIGVFIYNRFNASMSNQQDKRRPNKPNGLPAPPLYEYVTNNASRLTAVFDCITGAALYAGVSDEEKLVPLLVNQATDWRKLSQETRDRRVSEFSGIYSDGIWSRLKFPKSGWGSTLQFTTEIRKVLDAIIGRIKKQLGVSRIKMLDVPCGDMTWMQHFLATRDDVAYTGVDIVTQLIHSHRQRFSNFSNWNFQNRDVIADGLGGESYDLVFSRMMLQHLYTEDVMVFLKIVSKSNSKYLLTTTFPGTSVNSNLDSNHKKDRFRFLNLQAPPFLLSSMMCYSRDGPNVDNNLHYIGLWKLPLLQVKNCLESQNLRWPLSAKDTKYFGCGHFIS